MISAAERRTRFYLKKAPYFVLFTVLLFTGACKNNRQSKYDLLKVNGLTMGTTYNIRAVWSIRPGSTITSESQELRRAVSSRLEELNQLFSTFLPDSEISAFNRSPAGEWFPVSSLTWRLVRRANEISELSAGAFDITVAPLINLWGFKDKIKPAVPPDREAIRAAQALTGYRQLETADDKTALRKRIDGLTIELAAIAKGLAVDEIAALLSSLGCDNFLVEIGGEVLARGRNERGLFWKIGILSPQQGAFNLQRTLNLKNSALASSGDYHNYYEIEGIRYSHTIDPRSGSPINHGLASVSVIADSCMDADALATALHVLGPQAGMELAVRHNWAVLFVTREERSLVETMTPAFSSLLTE